MFSAVSIGFESLKTEHPQMVFEHWVSVCGGPELLAWGFKLGLARA